MTEIPFDFRGMNELAGKAKDAIATGKLSKNNLDCPQFNFFMFLIARSLT
jgi:hypothetical protein